MRIGEAEFGATAVITHRVRDGHRAEYEAWLEDISPLSGHYPGHLDWQIIRPIVGVTKTFTVIIRFDTQDHLKAWLGSPERNRLIEKVRPLLVAGDDVVVRDGLDFWFLPEAAKAQAPVRWKQLLVTWSAIYPLALGMPVLVGLALRWAGVPYFRYLDGLVVTGILVYLMVYVVMPRYTHLIRGWLFR
jgi:antibiotic biosynthesis monooxygenase (ABM) superfamily enzyme